MKEGESFEKFLGTNDYDEHLLRPFKKFLHASFSKHCHMEGFSA